MRQYLHLRLLQIFLDYFLVYAAFLLAYFLRVGWIFSTDFPFYPYNLISAFAALIWILFLLFTKYYRIPPRSSFRFFYDVILVVMGGALAVAFLILVYFFREELFFSRLINLYALFLGTLFLWSTQFLFRQLLRYAKKHHISTIPTLIIGANRVASKLVKAIKKDPFTLYCVVGALDPYGVYKRLEGSKILGKLNALEEVCREKKIRAIIQCDAFEHTINIIAFCEEKGIKYFFEPALRGIFEENLRLQELAGQPLISFEKRDYPSARKRFLLTLYDWFRRQVFDIA